MKKIIDLKNINRTFSSSAHSVAALKDINLTILPGEMVAIIGTSGSGKSTLMNIIGCLDRPDSGKYYILGQNTEHLSENDLAKIRSRHIGFIFQRYHLLPYLSALGNVELAAIYANRNREERCHHASLLLERLGLGGCKHKKPYELSGGQQQRVSIARSLINGAEIILADEPTGALDSQTSDKVLQTLRELNRQGHTVVMVTHDMNVAQNANRIIRLQDGVIIEDRLIKRHIYEKKTLSKVNIINGANWKLLLDRIREGFIMAFATMSTHRLRTALTISGIIFGIASVVTVVALGESAKQRTLEIIKGFGTNVISIYNGGNLSNHSIRPIIQEDTDVLSKQSFVDSVSSEVSTSEIIHFGTKNFTASIHGIGRDYFRVHGIKFIQGDTFNDDRNALQEAIIDDDTAQELFGKSDYTVLGQTVFISSVPVRIIGVTKSNRENTNGQVIIWIPFSTLNYRIASNLPLNNISLRLKNNINNEMAVSAITEIMSLRHDKSDFRLYNFDQIRKSTERTSMLFSLLILIISSIALMIGSLGVMNIMLVSVTERTHEIGLRIAIGARRSDILLQFISEAVFVCLIGGIAGIVLSLASGPLLTSLTEGVLNPLFSWKTTTATFFFSTLIGVIFGYIPANKAANISPATALAGE